MSINKQPRLLLDSIFAFAPNRETLGGTSYFIVETESKILVDCPAWNRDTEQFLHEHGGVDWLFLTHRGGISQHIATIKQSLGCQILIQEQEAYLLPGIDVITFEREFNLNSFGQALWTPGFSPGSSCLYYQQQGGILFTGRHLLPTPTTPITPIRTAKTFHWQRQLNSVKMLRDRFNDQTLNYIFPGANTGFLRGKGFIAQAYQHLIEFRE